MNGRPADPGTVTAPLAGLVLWLASVSAAAGQAPDPWLDAIGARDTAALGELAVPGIDIDRTGEDGKTAVMDCRLTRIGRHVGLADIRWEIETVRSHVN